MISLEGNTADRADSGGMGRARFSGPENKIPRFMQWYFPLTSRMERITAVVRGKVQGVGYRHFVAGCAHRTGVRGYVRNMPDGSVHMVAESSPASLADFLRLTRAEGEPVIRVEEMAITQEPATGEYHGFWVDW